MHQEDTYRLVTRSDFDGLVCAVLLRKLGLIHDVLFVHPKDVQDGKLDLGLGDILTNLPYVDNVHLVFDHHHSEAIRIGDTPENHVLLPDARSAARIVYEFYGGPAAFTDISDDLMDAVDRADSAQYTIDEIMHPTGWALLNVIMDSRTGLGRFRDFTVSNYQLMMQLIDYCGTHQNVDEILAIPDLAERVDLLRHERKKFIAQLRRLAVMHRDVVVLDMRDEKIIHAGSRFMVYALFPEARTSVHIMWGRNKQNTVFAVGKSIIDRSSPVDIGAVMLTYGGGGHLAAGTCQVNHEDTDATLQHILSAVSSPRGDECAK